MTDEKDMLDVSTDTPSNAPSGDPPEPPRHSDQIHFPMPDEKQLTLRAVASFYVQRNVPGIGGDGATALKRIDIPLSLLECWARSALG